MLLLAINGAKLLETIAELAVGLSSALHSFLVCSTYQLAPSLSVIGLEQEQGLQMAFTRGTVTAWIAAFPSNDRDRADCKLMFLKQTPQNTAAFPLKLTKEVEEIGA